MKQETIDKVNAMKPGEILTTKNHKLQCLTKKDGGGCSKCFFNKRKECRKVVCSGKDRKVCFPELKEKSIPRQKTGDGKIKRTAGKAEMPSTPAVLKKKVKTTAATA
ncbi:MAG TPA: hypothetical protein DE060_08065 [Lentisphaeria bacterium]|nr:hypothetical protein [Lentisphaeria bacterium]HCG49144.1 hypothetical protein [Lentisphaeria bacterium]